MHLLTEKVTAHARSGPQVPRRRFEFAHCNRAMPQGGSSLALDRITAVGSGEFTRYDLPDPGQLRAWSRLAGYGIRCSVDSLLAHNPLTAVHCHSGMTSKRDRVSQRPQRTVQELISRPASSPSARISFRRTGVRDTQLVPILTASEVALRKTIRGVAPEYRELSCRLVTVPEQVSEKPRQAVRHVYSRACPRGPILDLFWCNL
jgi:hypothetical protein